MSLTKQSAWAIFEGEKLGKAEAVTALNALTKPEFEAYQCWAEDFELAVAKIGVEAQNEAARVWEGNPNLVAELQSKKPYLWTVEDYICLVGVFRGTLYEELHLSAQFRIANHQLLLDLAKASL
jgi:hypothetical protein